MLKVTVNGTILYAHKGALLSTVLMESGVRSDHPCGGKGSCKKCSVIVNGKNELSCQYRIMGDIEVMVPDRDIVSESGARMTGTITDNMCLVLDLGTTTLALALVSFEKCITDVRCCTNSQRVFGADVISRIEYCAENGVENLRKAVLNDVNSLIAELGVKGELPLLVAGNTTMLHIFFGENPASMGVAPYKPVFLQSVTASGREKGLKGVSVVRLLPSVHAFVGADIVAGISLVSDDLSEKYRLLVDLGTNAEIALISRDKILVTSTAAGPCFEGASIACGMSATKGAICEYSEQGYKTIGGLSPRGICGTGLIDVIATLLSSGELDSSGYLSSPKRFIAPNIYITQDDVRQYQLAKSAVFSGVIALMKTADIGFEDIEELYISGGFSSEISLANATQTGLLPKELKEKIIILNNSSLLGAVKLACENRDLSDTTDRAKYVDLSQNEAFSSLFIENMMF